MASMKAVTFEDFGAPAVLRAASVERPEPGPDEVLVRIHAAGICYHDVLSRAGKIPGGKSGRILGHEIAGEIVSLGTDVPAERLGERVVIYQRLFCGACRYCLAGRQDLCRNSRVLGESGGGGYAEFTCVPVRNAIRIPDSLDMNAAALAVCPVGTSVRAALGVAQVEPRPDRADHRRRRRSRSAPDSGGQERSCGGHRRHQLGREGRRDQAGGRR